MKYNPDLHNRHSIRLRGYDYAGVGAYFVTICCWDRKCLFGKIDNGKMVFNEYGHLAYQEWQKLPERYPGIKFDIFQIMPNHVHGIIEIRDGATARDVRGVAARATARVAPIAVAPTAAPDCIPNANTVGRIVGAYKSLVFKKCLEISKLKNRILGKLWQRNYHEHIIRNSAEYARIAEYIRNNPIMWKKL